MYQIKGENDGKKRDLPQILQKFTSQPGHMNKAMGFKSPAIQLWLHCFHCKLMLSQKTSSLSTKFIIVHKVY